MSADDEEATPVHLGIWSRQKMTGEILQIKLSVQKLLMNIKES